MSIVSKQHQVREILKCGHDPTYFVNRYVKIQHPIRGTIPFETYPFQDDVINSLLNNKYNVIVKSRQLGISTVTAAYALWLAMFHRDKEILCIATKLKTAQNFIKKVKFAYNSLPQWIQSPAKGKVGDSKQHISFGNGSTITALPKSEDAGRSWAGSLLIVDEAAHIEGFDDIWAAIVPTLATGGGACMLSSPKGVGGVFYQTYVEAVAGVNDWNPISLPWDVHPERDEVWLEEQRKMFSDRDFRQEFLCVGAGARIVTRDGYKFVEDIEVGDVVLTHRGRFKRVLKTHRRRLNSGEKTYAVSVPGNRRANIVLTGNHPILSTKVNVNSSLSDIATMKHDWSFTSIDRLRDELPFKESTFFKRFICCIHPKLDTQEFTGTCQRLDLSELHPSTAVTDETVRYLNQWGRGTRRYVDVDYDLGRFVGLYAAEGSISRINQCGWSTQLAFHIDEIDTCAGFVRDFMRDMNVRVREYPRPGNTNSYNLQTSNSYIAALCRYFVAGDNAHTKALRMHRVLTCNADFVKGVVAGWCQGDGTHKPDKKIVTTSVSQQLLFQMRTLMSSFDCYPRINYLNDMPHDLELNCVDGRSIEQVLDEQYLTKKTSRTRLIEIEPDVEAYVGRVRFEEVDYDGFVYNFEVEDDHTYVVESLVVHNCDFLGSGDTYISVDDITYLREISRSPMRRDGPGGQVWVWEDPHHDHRYVISADVARGDSSGDYSTFHIFDNTEGEVVAEYMGHIRPDQFGKLLDTWGRKYNNALMVPESNTYGHHAITVLQHRDYPNFYYEQQEKNPHYYPSEDDIPGYSMQGKNKREAVLARMEEVIRNRLVRIYSPRFIDQLQTFTHNGKKAEARKGRHDDLIMSFAIGAKVIDVGSIDETARAYAYAMLAGTSRRTDKYTGVGVGPGGEGPKSAAYRNAWAVFNRNTIAEERGKSQPTQQAKPAQAAQAQQPSQPEAEKDFGAQLPESIRKRLGGLKWLY